MIGVIHTCTVGVATGPGESVLAHSSCAALQISAARASKFTGGAVVVAVAVAFHVAIVRGRQWSAASH